MFRFERALVLVVTSGVSSAAIVRNSTASHCESIVQRESEANALVVSHEEIEAVVENIDRDIIRSTCPHPIIANQIDNLSEEDLDLIKENVSQKVHHLFNSTNQKLYNDALGKLKQKMERKKQLQHEHLNTGSNTSDETKSWDELSNTFKCGICLHILAAPVVLTCSHSFCGECLHNLFSQTELPYSTFSSSSSSENQHEDTTAIISLCPGCRSEFETSHISYERVLDQIICSEVKEISAMYESSEKVQQEKEEWESRRQKYLDFISSSNTSKCQEKQRKDGNNGSYSFDQLEVFHYVTYMLVAVAVGMIYYLRK